MTVLTAECRRCVRVPAAYAARVYDRRGRFLGRGRVADISERGAFVVFSPMGRLRGEDQFQVEITLPFGQGADGRVAIRTVRYHCRMIHSRWIGHLLGVGVELLEKVR